MHGSPVEGPEPYLCQKLVPDWSRAPGLSPPAGRIAESARLSVAAICAHGSANDRCLAPRMGGAGARQVGRVEYG